VKKPSQLSDHEQVVEFIKNSDHPLKGVMEAVREIILNADPEITEHVKWNAPSFCFQSEDRVTLNLHSGEYILIVFHRGAKAKDRQGNSPLFEDPTGLLEWITHDRASVKLYTIQDVNTKKDRLGKVVNWWIHLTDE